jgi:hypothetical protein
MPELTQDTIRFIFGCAVSIVAIVATVVCIVVVVVNENNHSGDDE